MKPLYQILIMICLTQGIQAFSAELNTKTSMDFVGYYAAAMTGVGSKPDYIKETAINSNFIMVATSDLKDCLEKINKAKSYGLPVVLVITSTLYQPGSAKLYPDFKSRFQKLMADLKSVESNIVGFYPLDEPGGNNRVSGANKISAQELYDEQELVNAMIHQIYPDKVTMTIFSADETNPQLLLPQHTDYIGFDCYWSFGPACNPDRLIQRYQVLMSKKAAHQKLIAVVDSYINHPPSLSEQNQIVNRVQWWTDFIKDKPEFGALIPFIYQTHPGGNDPLYGAESMPLVKTKVEALMQSYLNFPQP